MTFIREEIVKNLEGYWEKNGQTIIRSGKVTGEKRYTEWKDIRGET
jgi:hypothetical protein